LAARRLIAILLVMLFLSSLAAALAPVQQGVNETTESGSTTSESAPEVPPAADAATRDDQLIRQSIDAAQGQPVVIRANPGDQLQLRVTSARNATVELVGLGPTEDVGPEQPAFFDVLLESEGTFPVRFLGEQREIARIEVGPPGAGEGTGAGASVGEGSNGSTQGDRP
jgi:hypothetical protein